MSQQNLSSSGSAGGFTTAPRKQTFNVYTMMLILSFFALVTGASLMAAELAKFGGFGAWKTTEAISKTSGS